MIKLIRPINRLSLNQQSILAAPLVLFELLRASCPLSALRYPASLESQGSHPAMPVRQDHGSLDPGLFPPHPFGPALRLFKIAPGDFISPFIKYAG